MPIYTQAVPISLTTSSVTEPIALVNSTPTITLSATLTQTFGSGGTLQVGDLTVLLLTGVTGPVTVASSLSTWDVATSITGGTSSTEYIWYGIATGPGGDTITLTQSAPATAGFIQTPIFRSTPVGTWEPGQGAAISSPGNTLPWAVPSSLPVSNPTNGLLYVALNYPKTSTSTYTPAAGYGSIGTAATMWGTYNTTITNPALPNAVVGTGTVGGVSLGIYFGAYQTVSTVGTASITMTPVPMGKSWVVSQMGFECVPLTSTTTAIATVQLNGRLLFGNANANGGFIQGPPYITISAGDALTISVTGLPTSTSAVVNLYYNEYVAGMVPDASNTI